MDLNARNMMSYAELLAGMAFNSAGLGYVHAMAHQLGGFYGLPHGVCNAVLLPIIMKHNAEYVPSLFIDIAKALGHEDHIHDENHAKAVRVVLEKISTLKESIGIPKNLKALGVKPEDFPILAEHALQDACGLTNPFQPTKEQVIQMYQEAYDAE